LQQAIRNRSHKPRESKTDFGWGLLFTLPHLCALPPNCNVDCSVIGAANEFKRTTCRKWLQRISSARLVVQANCRADVALCGASTF
jgi:hypothetical protein